MRGALFIAMVALSAPSYAQFSKEQRASIIQKGFTNDDIVSAELSQVQPHYHYFQNWQVCVLSIFRMTQDINILSAQKMSGLCESQAAELRASLGAKIGLAKANRAIGVLRFNISNEYVYAINEQKLEISKKSAAAETRKAEERKSEFWSSQDWHVKQVTDKACMIYRDRVDNPQYPEIFVMPLIEGYTVRLYALDYGATTSLKSQIDRSFEIKSDLYGSRQATSFVGSYTIRTDGYTPFFQIPLKDIPNDILRNNRLSLHASELDALKFAILQPIGLTVYGKRLVR